MKVALDITVPGSARDGADVLRREWNAQVETKIPLPPARPTGTGDYRIAIEHSDVDDAVIENLYSDSIIGGTGGDFEHLNDRILVHVVQRGEWNFASTHNHHAVSVPEGRFIVRHNDSSWRFGVAAHTTAKVLILPPAHLRPLLGGRYVTGQANSPGLQLLLAHVRMTESMLGELTLGTLQAARAAMVELTRGIVMQDVDSSEPLLAHALAHAARELISKRLSEPDLSPRMLAQELTVSVRTLNRAFAAVGEPVMACIRRGRLEQARHELASSRFTVSEIAARWQFADSSHFIRAFKKNYGQTPTEYARSQA